MPEKKLTLATARKKWATQSAKFSLTLGERIRLIYSFSQEAEQLRRTGVSEKEIQLAFCEIFTAPASGTKMGYGLALRYMRYHRLSPDVVEVIAEHASGGSLPKMGLSYGLELAEVKDHAIQRELVKSASKLMWSVRELRKMATPYSDCRLR